MEIQLYEKIQDPIAAAERMGTFFAKSGMFGCDKTEQGMVIALYCMAERKSPFDVIRRFHLMNGQLTKKALTQYAEFRALGGKVRWINTGQDGVKAEAEFIFEGEKPLIVSYTIDDAKRQGLVKPNSGWTKTPGNMLRSRLLTNALGMLCPEIVAGCAENPEDDGLEIEPPAPKQLFTVSESAKPIVEVLPAAPTPTPLPGNGGATPTAIPAPSEAAPSVAVVENGKLTAATVTALETAIGEPNALKSLEWLKTQGWIKANLSELSVKRANAILKRPEAFLTEVNRVAPTTP